MIDYEQIEDTIDYAFNNRDLLRQAFVRRSYSEENGGENNEVLEFIGDAALDFAVTKIIMSFYGQVSERNKRTELHFSLNSRFKNLLGIHGEGVLTELKKKLVQKITLAKCIDKLGFHKQLIMGRGDIVINAQESTSVKEDLFEAIIGAVAVDSDYDLIAITNVVEALLDFDSMFKGEFDENEDYVGLLQEWSQSKGYGLPCYIYWKDQDKAVFSCVVEIKDIKNKNGFDYTNRGYGTSHSKARNNAAQLAYLDLCHKGIIQNKIHSAIGEPIRAIAIRQVNEIYQKRLIAQPKYNYIEKHGENGNSFWTCELTVEGFDKVYSYTFSNRKDSQRECAYEFLCDLVAKKQ